MTLPDLCAGQTGHVNLHRNIRSRLLDVRDFASIQAAINAAKLAGKGSVYVPSGVYSITETILCAAGVDLIFENGAILKAAADVDVIKPVPQISISGMEIDTSDMRDYTKSAILFDGDLRFYFPHTVLSNITLTGFRSGTGIRFQAKQQASFVPYIYGVIFDNFSVRLFGNGVWMEVEELPGAGVDQWATINANQFTNGTFDRCNYAVRMNRIETQTAPNNLLGIGGNMFTNMQVQPDLDCLKAIYCETRHNMFSNFFVWDWQTAADPKAIEFTARSGRNMVTTNLGAAYMTNAGTDNKIVTPDT